MTEIENQTFNNHLIKNYLPTEALQKSKSQFQEEVEISPFLVEEISSSLLSPINQFTFQNLKLKENKADIAIDRIFVGDLHEKWHFPSDHLPVGAQIDNFRIVSWNILNTKYLDWVTIKDSQGLNGSMITDLNIALQPDGLTMRDQYIVEMVTSMINSSIDIIALQECSSPFLAELQRQLPSGWEIVKKSNGSVIDDEVILYNSLKFAYRPDLSEAVKCYPTSPTHTLLNAAFEAKEQNKIIHVINGHVPGDPALAGRQEYADYVHQQFSPEKIIVALGDYNFERKEMLDAFQNAGFNLSDFEFYTPWHTNIAPYTKEAKSIDHIFISGTSARILQTDEIVPGYHLKEMQKLLQPDV